MLRALQTAPAPWHGIRTRSKHEKLAATVLEMGGFQTFLPIYKTRRRWSDRVVTTELPLFPGYFFCRFDHHTQRNPIIKTHGVVSVVGCGSQPAPIPDDEIEAIRTIIDSGIFAEPAPFLREGQRVRVSCGPLKSVEGVLIRKSSSCRLLVSIEILQRSVSVAIDPAHIEAL